jgi:hypothetical protein
LEHKVKEENDGAASVAQPQSPPVSQSRNLAGWGLRGGRVFIGNVKAEFNDPQLVVG